MMDKDVNDMVKKGLLSVDKSGELSLTEKGQRDAMALIKENPEYMKQVVKKFEGEKIEKETINISDLQEELDKVDSIKLGIYEKYGISENDALKNYQLFCKFVEKNPKINSDAVFGLMKESKYFEIPDNVNLLLQNTSNKVRKVRMPHYIMFLDFSIVIYDKIFHSMLITDLISLSEKFGKNDLPQKIDVMSFFSCEEGIGWVKTDLLKPSRDKYIKKLQEYLMNFIDFVNEEDVKLMFKERTDKNTERRIQRGKLPLPSFNKIYLVGYLKKYLENLESQEINTRFSHRFWVRGHFRRYWDKDKYKNLYEKYKKGELKKFEGKKYKFDEGTLRVWVYPYIKGDGILINKGYKLK